MSRRDVRQLRSNWVGSSPPTSTPRWTSRHRLASREGLRPYRRSPQRRWCPADGDLRRPRRGLAQREHGRHTQRLPSRASPPAQRRPLRAPRRASGHADPLANLPRSLVHDRPQRQRHRDRREAVVPPGCYPTRHHQDDCLAAKAAIPTTSDERLRWCRVRIGRSEDLAVTKSVAMQPQSGPGRPAGSGAPWARARPSSLGSRRLCNPPLDVELVVNDE
jgi:hypothetical protein